MYVTFSIAMFETLFANLSYNKKSFIKKVLK